jgi:hypothetical protein
VRPSRPTCDACGALAAADAEPLSIEGRHLVLCPFHAARLGDDVPTTLGEAEQRLGVVPLDRRSEPERRSGPDRRMFPPRPESRRSSHGRRASDPKL